MALLKISPAVRVGLIEMSRGQSGQGAGPYGRHGRGRPARHIQLRQRPPAQLGPDKGRFLLHVLILLIKLDVVTPLAAVNVNFVAVI